MFVRTFICAVIASAFVSLFAIAELQNVEVGGSIEVYGAWYSPFYESDPNGVVRIPEAFLPGRPIGGDGTLSFIRADGRDHSWSFVDQRTRLHADADFSEEVSAYVEVESIDGWGSDFRSDYITGLNAPTGTDDDLEVYQSYVEAQHVFDLPVSVRVGRQEIVLGSGWLVGNNPDPDPFTGLSFDAVRLTFCPDPVTVDVWSSKLAERFAAEEDGDVDFYGVYASLATSEEVVFDTYWLYVRDATSRNDTDLPALAEYAEDLLGVDDYDVTQLHTVGARGAGARNGLDWEVEAAYQFGEADAVGARFVAFGGVYGDDGARWDTWAGHGEIGYTFNHDWAPRVYTGAQYYGGEDNRSISFREWLNPFRLPEASVSFNRLFSDYENDSFLDGSSLTNFWMWSVGASATPAEAIEIGLDVTYQEVVEPFATPTYVTLGDWRMPVAPDLSFWDREGADDIGWQTTLWANYEYSEDLSFEVGWSHFFVGDAIADGAFIDGNGLSFVGGRDSEDADYVYWLTSIEF